LKHVQVDAAAEAGLRLRSVTPSDRQDARRRVLRSLFAATSLKLLTERRDVEVDDVFLFCCDLLKALAYEG